MLSTFGVCTTRHNITIVGARQCGGSVCALVPGSPHVDTLMCTIPDPVPSPMVRIMARDGRTSCNSYVPGGVGVSGNAKLMCLTTAHWLYERLHRCGKATLMSTLTQHEPIDYYACLLMLLCQKSLEMTLGPQWVKCI